MAHDHKQGKKRYKELFALVAKVIEEWDPYSLLANGAPAGEFEEEVSQIVAQVKNIRSTTDATQIISRVFSSSFEAELFTPDACTQVGAKLFEALKGHGYA